MRVAGLVQNGTLTTKNSPARNLHRLVSAVDFIKVLLQNLADEPPVTLHTACADAYNKCAAAPTLTPTQIPRVVMSRSRKVLGQPPGLLLRLPYVSTPRLR